MTGYSGFLGCIVACLVSVVACGIIASESGFPETKLCVKHYIIHRVGSDITTQELEGVGVVSLIVF